MTESATATHNRETLGFSDRGQSNCSILMIHSFVQQQGIFLRELVSTLPTLATSQTSRLNNSALLRRRFRTQDPCIVDKAARTVTISG